VKDLICITAHCPNAEKRKILLDLVLGLQPIRDDFDIMVVSHTPITFDVQEKVDWAIYDKDNELLTITVTLQGLSDDSFHPTNTI